MDVVWSLLDRGWPMSAPADLFLAKLGDTARRLHALDLLGVQPLTEGVVVGERCDQREVVRYRDRVYAVCRCPGDCQTIDLLHHEHWTLDLTAVNARLRMLLNLTGPVESPFPYRVNLVGRRCFGRQRLTFAFTSRAFSLDPIYLADWLRTQGDAVVIMAPELPNSHSPLAHIRGVTWLPLCGIVDLERGVAPSEFARRLPLDEEGRAALCGRRFAIDREARRLRVGASTIDLARHPIVFALISALEQAEDGFATREELYAALYPDDVTSFGRYRVSETKLERRLKDVVAAARRMIRETDVEVHFMRNDGGDGGYRLRYVDGTGLHGLLPAEQGWMARGGM